MFISSKIKKHNQFLRFFFLLLLISFSFACERTNRSQFFALGTVVTADIRTTPKTAESFLNDLQTNSTQQEQQFYAWGNGDLALINQSLKLGNCAEQVNQSTISLLLRAKELSGLSQHLFEPSIAPLVELWGFHDATKMSPLVPTQAAIDALLEEKTSINNLQINPNSVCPSQAMQIDLGAIAKGWAAQEANYLLEKYSINNALIDFGGDLILRGKNSKKQAWKVGLRDPDAKENPVASFQLSTKGKGMAVFTSGDYERQFTLNGKNYHHILDPRNGYPATEARSVTVIHDDPVVADAAATALFIAGTNWQSVANAMSLQDVLIIFPNKRVEISASLQAKTSWLNSTYQVTVVDTNNNKAN